MVDPLSCFSFQAVIHYWRNKDCGMYYVVHVKEPLLLIGMSSPSSGGSGGFLWLSHWPFTICAMPYNRK